MPDTGFTPSPGWGQPQSSPPKQPMPAAAKIAVGVVGGLLFFGGCNALLTDDRGVDATMPAAAPQTASPRISAARSQAPAPTAPKQSTPPAPAAPQPTFIFPGDPQCAITYRDNSDGSMAWIVTTTIDGEIITHASGVNTPIYRHDQHITRGPNAFRAPVSLSQIDDIGGNLRADDGSSYGCSVQPAQR